MENRSFLHVIRSFKLVLNMANEVSIAKLRLEDMSPNNQNQALNISERLPMVQNGVVLGCSITLADNPSQ